jgi:hypothetical protein
MLNVVCASHGSYAHCRKFEADPKREAAAVKVDFLHHHRRRFETHTQARLWPAKMRGSAGSAAASCCSAAQDGPPPLLPALPLDKRLRLSVACIGRMAAGAAI